MTRATAGEPDPGRDGPGRRGPRHDETEGDSFPPRYPERHRGDGIRVAAEAVKSWNLIEAGLGVAAVNAFYNTPERMAELAAPSPTTTTACAGWTWRERGSGSSDICGCRRVRWMLRRASAYWNGTEAGDYPDSACEFILPDCDVVLITGSSLVNKTLPRLLELCRNAYVVLTGPTVLPARRSWTAA